MKIANLKNKAFIFNNWRYFTTTAENIKLGSYGNKIVSLANANYLAVIRTIDLDGVDIDKVEPISFDFSKVKKGDFKFASPIKVVDINANADYEGLKSGNLVLLKFSINMGTLLDILNSKTQEAEKAIKELKKLKRPRLVNQIFSVVSAELASKLSASTSLKAKSNVNGIDISGEIGGSMSNASIVKLSEGTVFAYGLLEPIFQKPKAQAQMIETFAPDQQGIG